MRVKWKESARIAELVAAKRNRCFTNCYRVIKRVDGYKAALLVRGKVILQTADETCEVPHVWIENDGWIIDPTLVVVREKGDKLSYKPLKKVTKLPKVARLFGFLVPTDLVASGSRQSANQIKPDKANTLRVCWVMLPSAS